MTSRTLIFCFSQGQETAVAEEFLTVLERKALLPNLEPGL